ncbi:MAG: hypothetical protein IT215_01040 [Chitinophagaceae bacterium]|nr:MAG: hypothetical protein UZ11_BCD004001602 [Bacteroidetes bacterium OLB11]MCC6447257.1 hypothetical protein [Chitinophagaceae bacterium]HMN33114.1 hypothetical protein [Chitinophagaceae bacterium]
MNLRLTVLMMIISHFGFCQNSISIVPDSTNQFAQILMSRAHASQYKIIFQDSRSKVFYKMVQNIDSTPTLIKVPWQQYEKGTYYMVLKNKKEEIKLMFLKE